MFERKRPAAENKVCVQQTRKRDHVTATRAPGIKPALSPATPPQIPPSFCSHLSPVRPLRALPCTTPISLSPCLLQVPLRRLCLTTRRSTRSSTTERRSTSSRRTPLESPRLRLRRRPRGKLHPGRRRSLWSRRRLRSPPPRRRRARLRRRPPPPATPRGKTWSRYVDPVTSSVVWTLIPCCRRASLQTRTKSARVSPGLR